jgi:dTMP kinase
LLDVDTVTGLSRAKAKGVDRMEKKKLAYHKRVRAGYLKLAKKYPGRIKVVKVRDTIEDTQALVRQEAQKHINRVNRAGNLRGNLRG